jgi:predicted small metal-binding protein
MIDREDCQERRMKQFNCGDVVPGCTWVTRRDGEDELMVEISSHAHDTHGMDEVPPEVMDLIRAVITEV